MLLPVLSTKLHMPETRGGRLERSALVEKMASGIRMNTKLTLVSAPAGYGKTTLVLELLKTLRLKCTWISLDESDNDLPQFLSYCIAALKKVGVTIGVETENLVSDFNLSSSQLPMTMIINDIALLSDKIILVLDDFHLIHSPLVYNAVKFLLEHQPLNFHLIIITREDPHLPLSNLRVQREITEIRRDDLCFTTEETGTFMREVMGLKLNPEVVKAVAYRTEGWVAGLQLVGLSLNDCEEEDIDEFIREFKGTHRYVIDYLVEEVINRQTDEIREFLCKTSILDRMNGALCDLILDRSGAKKLLNELEKANLFLIPLDSKGEWFRYHHLFADSLRAELTEEEERGLHRKAAEWFRDNGFKQEAVKHALKSRDMLLSVKLVEESTEDAFKNAQLLTLIKWIDSLPGDLVKGSEILSVRKVWALLITGKTSEAVKYLNSLGEDFFERTTSHNKGLILSFKANITLNADCAGSEALAKEALSFLEPWDPIARVSTMNSLGRAQERSGRIKEANGTFTMAYNEALKLGCSFITTITAKYLGTSLYTMGKSREAMDLYTAYIERMIGEFGKVLPYIGIIYLGMAELFYERNELHNAKDHMEKGMELCRGISYEWAPHTELVYSRIKSATGENEAAVKSVFQEEKAPLTELKYIEKLSKREIEILKHISAGMSNNEISEKLFISNNTTQWHISNIFAKLGVKNRTQAVLKARQSGIL